MSPSSGNPTPSDLLIRVDGHLIPQVLRENMLQLTVEEGIHAPGLFTLVLHVISVVEAEQTCQSPSSAQRRECMEASAAGPGNPEIHVGKVIRLQDVSLGTGTPRTPSIFDGEYTVIKCRHLYREHTYTTEFFLRSFDGVNPLNTVSNGGSNPLSLEQTAIDGITTENRDPKGWERMKFPLLELIEEDQAGKQQGYSFQLAGDHKVRVHESDRCVELETAGGLKITMDDARKNITIFSNGSLDIKADGNIRIKGMNVYIN